MKLSNFKNSPSKKYYAYLLTPEGIQEKSLLTFRFIERKREEYKILRKEIMTLEKEVEMDRYKKLMDEK